MYDGQHSVFIGDGIKTFLMIEDHSFVVLASMLIHECSCSTDMINRSRHYMSYVAAKNVLI